MNGGLRGGLTRLTTVDKLNPSSFAQLPLASTFAEEEEKEEEKEEEEEVEEKGLEDEDLETSSKSGNQFEDDDPYCLRELPFRVLDATSEDGFCTASQLEPVVRSRTSFEQKYIESDEEKTTIEDGEGWCTKAFCSWPQSITIEFEHCSRVDKLLVRSHPYRIPQRIALYAIGPSQLHSYYIGHVQFQSNLMEDFSECEEKLVPIHVYCTALRLEIEDCFHNKLNLFQQANLTKLQVWGASTPSMRAIAPAPVPSKEDIQEGIGAALKHQAPLSGRRLWNRLESKQSSEEGDECEYEVIETARTVDSRFEHGAMTEVDLALLSVGVPMEVVCDTANRRRIYRHVAVFVQQLEDAIRTVKSWTKHVREDDVSTCRYLDETIQLLRDTHRHVLNLSVELTSLTQRRHKMVDDPAIPKEHVELVDEERGTLYSEIEHRARKALALLEQIEHSLQQEPPVPTMRSTDVTEETIVQFKEGVTTQESSIPTSRGSVLSSARDNSIPTSRENIAATSRQSARESMVHSSRQSVVPSARENPLPSGRPSHVPQEESYFPSAEVWQTPREEEPTSAAQPSGRGEALNRQENAAAWDPSVNADNQTQDERYTTDSQGEHHPSPRESARRTARSDQEPDRGSERGPDQEPDQELDQEPEREPSPREQKLEDTESQTADENEGNNRHWRKTPIPAPRQGVDRLRDRFERYWSENALEEPVGRDYLKWNDTKRLMDAFGERAVQCLDPANDLTTRRAAVDIITQSLPELAKDTEVDSDAILELGSRLMNSKHTPPELFTDTLSMIEEWSKLTQTSRNQREQEDVCRLVAHQFCMQPSESYSNACGDVLHTLASEKRVSPMIVAGSIAKVVQDRQSSIPSERRETAWKTIDELLNQWGGDKHTLTEREKLSWAEMERHFRDPRISENEEAKSILEQLDSFPLDYSEWRPELEAQEKEDAKTTAIYWEREDGLVSGKEQKEEKEAEKKEHVKEDESPSKRAESSTEKKNKGRTCIVM